MGPVVVLGAVVALLPPHADMKSVSTTNVANRPTPAAGSP
jgi:hypothetical protein